ncbi:MAG: diacylglycerol kinase family protein [Chitinophagaceae bacterium]|nr:diacylglycerol kinase family protein [Chitinophagaceae bacterium]
MQSKRFSISDRFKSFAYAARGIRSFLISEHNAWLHLVATIAVITLGFIVRLASGEWIAILIAIAIVWIAEMLNTCIEKMMDIISPTFDPRVRFIKDVAAGAVLVAAIAALAIGLIIFIPHIQ